MAKTKITKISRRRKKYAKKEGDLGYISPEEHKKIRRMGRTSIIVIVTTLFTAIIMGFIYGYVRINVEDVIYLFGMPFSTRDGLGVFVPAIVAIIVGAVMGTGVLAVTLASLDRDGKA